ncbi:uncharacterized protein (DUF1501 family) [Rhodopirellula rubra]|uniref:Uncharacterized protein (DUF1501 family) n=1 Tax=Aporhodopirellula rubra TaxID=980271 RepID=A0A7W5H6X2_9BACT|nr:DUF1501 domain-containing protein [Aporhodopirellula rubra]MBB3207400.1 uncharacterized protein (DUF1501 family) [Aporhodopirellula rubra]
MKFSSPTVCNPFEHFSRRQILGAGGGLILSGLARRLAVAAEQATDPGKPPMSVILLWLEGGPSQLETFDPHPGVVAGGDAQAIATSLKGLQIADTLAQTAEQMHLATLVRSVVGKEGDHERAVYNIKTGYRPDPTLIHPSIGAVLCDADDSGADIPRHISILPGGSPARGGFLGARLDAFKTGDPRSPVPDVKARVEDERYHRRLADLSDVLETQFMRRRLIDMQSNRTLHMASTEAARRMMSSDQLSAFDVMTEPAASLVEFGDDAFGRGCLAAARLIEVGVRCVEVTLGGWDSHVNNHSLQSSAAGRLDPALASLMKRLEERGLLESTLVVCGGEFGRTPRINPAGGRDHWPHGFSMLLAGGKFRRGHVHGATSKSVEAKDAEGHVGDPVTIADIHATIHAALGLDPSHEYSTPIGRPMARSEGRVLSECLQG